MPEISDPQDATRLARKTQEQVLRLYQSYRDSSPSLGHLIGRNLGRYLLMVFAAVIGSVLLFVLQSANAAFLVLGLLLGALLRDLVTFRRFVRTWPVTESVLDWQEIERRLDGGDGG